MITIYKLTSPSGKSYIGLTRKTLEHRWRQHVKDWRRKHGHITKLHRAFNKYPPEQWRREVLCVTGDAKKETELIREHDTIRNGYNIQLGGEQGNYGITRREDSKEKQRAALIKWWATPEGEANRQVVSERHKGNKYGSGKGDKIAKSYLIRDPAGNEFIITNLAKWCKQHGISNGNMYQWTCKGYKLLRKLGRIDGNQRDNAHS